MSNATSFDLPAARATRCGRRGQETNAGIGRHDPPLAHGAALCGVCRGSGAATGRGEMERVGRRFLDRHPLRHRRPPRKDVPDRLQRHQRLHDRRKRTGRGRLCELAIPRQRTSLRHCLRHAAQLAALCRVVQRGDGGRRIHSLISSTATAARRNFLSQCAIHAVRLAAS